MKHLMNSDKMITDASCMSVYFSAQDNITFQLMNKSSTASSRAQTLIALYKIDAVL